MKIPKLSTKDCITAAACVVALAAPVSAQPSDSPAQKPADDVLTFVVEHGSDGDGTVDVVSTMTNAYDRQGNLVRASHTID